MSATRRHHIGNGAVAGMGAALIAAVGLASQDPPAAGLLGLALTGSVGWLLNLAAGAALGAMFGLLFGFVPRGQAATVTGGVMLGLLAWILGPMTLAPLVAGTGPTWSVGAAATAFPSLVGHLFYGGLLGVIRYALGVLVDELPDGARPQGGPQRRVVVVGGGFGGVAAARRLAADFARDAATEIVLVSDRNYLLFTPLLAEVASSGLQPQHVTVPVRAAAPHTGFRHATVDEIDLAARTVCIRPNPTMPPETLSYDHLVLALGSTPHDRGVPGVSEYAFTLKSLEDARRLRDHVIGMLEYADVEPERDERRRQLTFVVAGGGFAGAETAAELLDLVQDVLRYYPNVPADELRLVLVHAGDRILPELSPELAETAREGLAARGIELRLGRRVDEVAPGVVRLDDGEALASYTVVWAAGNRPHPLLTALPVSTGAGGRLCVRPTLQLEDDAQVWVVGDAAHVPDPAADGEPYPPTAQHAQRQGRHVADNIAAVLRGRPEAVRPFRYQTLGMLVGLGRHMAVAEVRGLRFSGFFAWLMWRAVYLAKTPGLEKQVRVLFDWLLELFFPRDIVMTARPMAPTQGERAPATDTGSDAETTTSSAHPSEEVVGAG